MRGASRGECAIEKGGDGKRGADGSHECERSSRVDAHAKFKIASERVERGDGDGEGASGGFGARARAERAAAQTAAAEKVREVQAAAAENEDWLVRALEVKSVEMAKLEARQRELGKRVQELTESLGEALATLDEHRAEAKSIIKREKKNTKALHDKYKSSKREKSELAQEVADLRLAAAEALESSRLRFSYQGAVESSLKMALLALEYPDPFAAAVIVLWHAAASLIHRGGVLRVVGFLPAASASPLDFDVSGFASLFQSSSSV